MEVFAALAAARQGSVEARLHCFAQLVGPAQWWVRACREAVAARRPDLLDLAGSTPLAWAASLIAEHLPLDASAVAARPTAIAALAAALLAAEHDPAATDRFLSQAAATWAGATPAVLARTAGTAWVAAETSAPGLAIVLDSLAAFHPTLAAPLSDLACDLAGARLPPLVTVRLPMVLDQSSGGLVADLTLEQVAGVPAACYPDPAAMAFCALDGAFVQALAMAEQIARTTGGVPAAPAVRWRLQPRPTATRREPRLVALRGGSAGLGFALGLRQIGDPAAPPLSRHWAVTGALDDAQGRIGSVRGYAAKLAAASEARLSLLYPAVDQQQVAALLPAAQLQTRAVTHVEQALAFVRGHERPPCPYRGLDHFTVADAPFFYGRDAEVARIHARIAARPRLLALLGSSGSGKSSLIHAGLLAGVSQRHPDWQVTIVRPAEHPLRALADAGLNEQDADLAAILRRRHRLAPGTHQLLIIDQFEEVLALAAPAERTTFLAQLQAVLMRDLAVTLLLVMRSDFYSQLNRLAPALMQYVAANQILLPDTLEPAAVAAMIAGPAHASGAQLEPGLVERISADLLPADAGDAGDAGAILPLLEFTLTRLWEESDGTWLSHAAYNAIGGAKGALVAWGTRTMEQLPAARRQLVDRLLLELVQPGDAGEGLPDSRRRRTIADLRASLNTDDDLAPVMRHLIAARLLVSGRDGARETIELVHDALVREWNYLGDLLDRNRRFLAWKRDCEAQLQRWQLAGMPESRLLPADELGAAQRWRAERAHDLGAPLLHYLTASAGHWQRQRRRAQWTRRGLIGLLVAVVLVLSSAFIQTSGSLRRSEAERAALIARQNLDMQPEQAIRQALGSFAHHANPFTEETLHLVAQGTTLRAVLAGHRQSLLTLALSPDGRTLATAGSDRTILLWDLPEASIRQRLAGHSDQINALAFSPDGSLLASAAGPSDPDIRLWDVTRGRQLGSLAGHRYAVTDLAFSPDGAYLASSGGMDEIAVPGDGSVRLWDVTARMERAMLQLDDPNLLRVAFDSASDALILVSPTAIVRWQPQRDLLTPLAPPPAGLTAADLATDGTLLALASGDGRIRLRDLSAAATERTLQIDAQPVTALRFSPDDRTLLSGQADGPLRLWDVDSGEILHTYRGHDDEVLALAFSADGRLLFSGGRDRLARIWAVAPGAEAHQLLHLHGPIHALAFSPDGTMLALAEGDGHVRLHQIGSTAPDRLIAVSRGAARALVFDPGGRILAIGDSSGMIVLWDVADGRKITRLHGHRGPIQALRFHPERPLLASIATDDTLRLWDQRAGWRGPVVAAHAFDPVGLAFSPDGASLVTASRDQTVRRWAAAGERELGDPIRVDALIRALAVDARGNIHVGLASNEIRGFSLQGRPRQSLAVSAAPLAVLATAEAEPLVISANAATRYVAGQPLRYARVDRPLSAAALSPDGRLLALGDADGTVRLILIDPAQLAGVLEDRLRHRR